MNKKDMNNNGDYHQQQQQQQGCCCNCWRCVEEDEEVSSDHHEIIEEQQQQHSLLASMHNLGLSDYPDPGTFLVPNQHQLGIASSNLTGPGNNVLNYQPRNYLEQPIENNNMGIGYNSLGSPNILHPFRGMVSSPNLFSLDTNNTSNNNYFNSLIRSSQSPAPYPSSNGYHMATIKTPNSIGLVNQQHYPFNVGTSTTSNPLHGDHRNIFTLAMTREGSRYFLDILKSDHYQTQAILDRVVSSAMTNHISLVAAACDHFGTRVIQRLIKMGKKLRNIELLPSILALYVKCLMKNKIGWHVVQECCIHLDDRKNKLLNAAILDHWWSIANHKRGCVALNDCINVMDTRFRNVLLNYISREAKPLSLQLYGNFVLQFVISMNNPFHNEEIIANLEPIYETLCTTQSGSHVVEKCLDTPYTSYVVKALLRGGKLLQLSQDPFGNYVIQKALRRAKENDASLYGSLCNELWQGLNELESNPYGRNVANFLREGKVGNSRRTFYKPMQVTR